MVMIKHLKHVNKKYVSLKSMLQFYYIYVSQVWKIYLMQVQHKSITNLGLFI